MQTRALETLLEISRVGSFATAARNLHMTLSAVSMQMKSLEAELGVTLFDRSFRPPIVTPMGRAVCRRASEVVLAEKALRLVCAEAEEPSGTMRVGFVMTASVRLLPAFLLNARDRFPRVDWEIASGLSESLERDVLAGRLDGAVVTASPTGRPGLRYDLVREEPLMFAVPSSASERPMIEIERELPFLQFAPSSGIGKLISGHAVKRRYPTGTTIVLESIESIMECVSNELGFSLLPLPDIERYAGGRAAIRPMRDEDALARQLVLATRARDPFGMPVEPLVALFEERPERH